MSFTNLILLLLEIAKTLSMVKIHEKRVSAWSLTLTTGKLFYFGEKLTIKVTNTLIGYFRILRFHIFYGRGNTHLQGQEQHNVLLNKILHNYCKSHCFITTIEAIHLCSSVGHKASMYFLQLYLQ